MSTLQKIFLVLWMALVLGPYATPAWSDEGHPHKGSESKGEQHEQQAPHGGKMATAGSNHVNVVLHFSP